MPCGPCACTLLVPTTRAGAFALLSLAAGLEAAGGATTTTASTQQQATSSEKPVDRTLLEYVCWSLQGRALIMWVRNDPNQAS